MRFGKAFGVRADTLMRLQIDFEPAQARGCKADLNVQHFNLIVRPLTEQRTI